MKRLLVVLYMLCLVSGVDAHSALRVILSSPQAYQVYQSDLVTGTATMIVSGRVSGLTYRDTQSIRDTPFATSLALTWNGYEAQIWADSAGRFYFEWAGLPAGAGYLIVRIAGTTTYQQKWVSIGDVYVVAGQSNAIGRGDHFQSVYPYFGLSASRFGRDYQWSRLADPVDGVYGSFWPLFATLVLRTHTTVALIPTAAANTSILDWQPGGALYESMVSRIRALKLKNVPLSPLFRAVLWEQGETDAHTGMSAQDYANNLEALAAAVWAEFQRPLYPARLQHMSYATQAQVDAINAGIDLAVSESPSIIAGANLSDLTADNRGHFTTDASLRTVARRWYDALAMDGIYPPLP